MANLKEQIRKTPKGGIIEIPFGGEYQEKLVINKPVQISSGMAIATIVGKSPTVIIKKDGVTLENLHIECSEKTGICLSVKKGVTAKFTNVSIKGGVEGLKGEDGIWEIPDVLELALEPNKPLTKKMIICCPFPATLYPSDIASIKCSPNKLSPGVNEIILSIDEIYENAIIAGDLIIESEKYKLKRKISITGNTFNNKSTCTIIDDEYLWICDSAKCTIKTDLIKRLPVGEQNDPYCFVLEEKTLDCKDYDITVEGLPDGFTIDRSKSGVQIEGVTDKFGEFELTFIFKKNGISFKFPSKLEINEKKIIPLKVKPFPDPIEAKENEVIKVKIDILSSNSPKISFKLKKKLPKDLELNTSTGFIEGSISHHGFYDASIEIMDDINVLEQPVTFLIKPKAPIELNIEESYKCYKNEEFEIPIVIGDAKSLAPTVTLVGRSPTQIKLELRHGKHFLKGRLAEIKKHSVKFNVKDKYGRQLRKTIIIKCVEKQRYTVSWYPESTIHKIGNLSDTFNIQINAEIKEDSNLKPKYCVLKKLPPNYNLQENGSLQGIIDGKSHCVKVRAEIGDWRNDTVIEIITIVDTSKFVKGSQITDIFTKERKRENHHRTPTGLNQKKAENKKLVLNGGPWIGYKKKEISTAGIENRTGKSINGHKPNDNTKTLSKPRKSPESKRGPFDAFSKQKENSINNVNGEMTSSQSNKINNSKDDAKKKKQPKPKQKVGKAFE